MAILVTGGAGYIGSHTCVELLNAGYDVVVADNLYNSSKKALDRVEPVSYTHLDVYKRQPLNSLFAAVSLSQMLQTIHHVFAVCSMWKIKNTAMQCPF